VVGWLKADKDAADTDAEHSTGGLNRPNMSAQGSGDDEGMLSM
jgi:hypothetical protein